MSDDKIIEALRGISLPKGCKPSFSRITMGIIAYDRGQVLGKHGIKYCWLDGERTSISGAARTLGFSQSAVWNWTQGKYPKKVPSNLVFEEPKNV